MKCSELLDRFWSMDRDFSDKETILYFYLLHRCNSLGWPDTFSLSNDELIGALRCRPTAMRDARSGLVEAGLISFQARFGRGENSTFSIIGADEKKVRNGNTFLKKGTEWEHLFDEEKVRNGNTFSDVISSNSAIEENKAEKKGTEWEHLFDEKKEETKEKKTFPPAPPIKEKKEKKKSTHTISASVHAPAHTCETGQFTLFPEKVPPLKKKRVPAEPNLPGSIDDVFAFFEKNAAHKLPDWKTEAELFYYHYDSLGWMGTSNRKIQDWEAKANLWICDKLLKLKETTKKDGTTTNWPNSARESRLADAASLIDELISENKP